MARLLTTGFETRRFTTSATTNGEGQLTVCAGTPTFDTTEPWSGSGWAKFAKGTATTFEYVFTGTAGRTYYAQAAVKVSDEVTTNLQESLIEFRHSGGTLAEARINEDTGGADEGELQIVKVGGGEVITGTGYFPTAGVPFIIEMAVMIPAAGNGTLSYKVRDEDGAILKEATSSPSIGTTQIAKIRTGHGNSVETESDVYAAQFILNDSTGEKENSWVGYQKVALLKAVSDNNREGFVTGAGGTTNLYDAVDNYPPTGVANGSKTATSQDYSATSSTTHYFRANTATYEAAIASGGAAMAASDVLKVAMAVARISNSATTERSMGLKCHANPEIGEITAGTISGTAAGTEPTGWKTIVTAPVYEPSVTRSSGAQPNIRKNAASTDATACDMLGVYVSYEPEEESEGEEYKVTLEETITINDALTKGAGKVLGETVTINDALTRKADFKRVLSETVTINDAIAKGAAKVLTETITVNDALSKGAGKVLKETVTISDELGAELGLPGGVYVYIEGNWVLTAVRFF